ncbi:MAG: response regulator [Gammaproteobacteria bacterium]|nr:response regulator [Gammaproteobacteria bacterium]MDJ0871793.1 response regulator [Gammaproteobacteria bacterium]MDJ0890937.1 response regulator [Gammaproteobacteria bacterium]
MSLRILIVDDEPLVAENLEAFFEDEGMQVTSVGTAEHAIELVESGSRWDVCVMDLRLPGIDGGTAIQRLHGIRPDMRFVIHTGSVAFSVPNDLRALGISDFQLFKKPVADLQKLAETVKSLAVC